MVAPGFSRQRGFLLLALLWLPAGIVGTAWVPPRHLDCGHGAWGRDSDDISDCRALRTAGHCGLRRGAESSGLGHGNMAGQETAAKGA